MAKYSTSLVHKLSKILLTAGLIGVASVSFAVSPYIDSVYAYYPAPGQFINTLPEYTESDTEESMCLKAQTALRNPEDGMICLGGFGGYVVFGFDHPIVNVPDQRDIRIYGNAFENSSEPGVIFVSYDANENGIPDDTWYEIAGSEYGNKSRYSDYQITYFRTPDDHVATPKMADKLSDTTYIEWRDNKGNKGYIEKNVYHSQSYFPQWINEDKLVFNGTLLPKNVEVVTENNTKKYLLHNFAYGYADNQPNDSDAACIDLDWAKDDKGQDAKLGCIHFVKIQTGVNQQCGWIGETSTELAGAEDLHPEAPMAIDLTTKYSLLTTKVVRNGQLYILRDGKLYTITGAVVE